jgi:hypothetical protein
MVKTAQITALSSAGTAKKHPQAAVASFDRFAKALVIHHVLVVHAMCFLMTAAILEAENAVQSKVLYHLSAGVYSLPQLRFRVCTGP